MALPSTGGTYDELFRPQLNPLAIRKGIVTDAFVRDYHQSATSLADPAVGLGDDGYFSPYAQDGYPRDDLLITSDSANLGFWHLGHLGVDGINFDPQMDSEEVPTAQTLRPAREDVIREGEMFTIVCLEQTPLVRYLVNELPLVDVPDLGQAHLTIPKPMEAGIVERQFILWGFDGGHFFARTIPRCSKVKVREFAWKREGKEGTGVTLDFKVLPCPYVGKPVLEHYEGPAHRALGGYATFPPPAPVATSVTPEKATITFAEAVGPADPFTYKVYKINSSTGERTLATIDTGYPTVAGGTVTIRVTGISDGVDFTFEVEATGTNGLTTVSLESNEITGDDGN